MIRFGLRLTLRGGREAAARLVIIIAAVMLGVGLLLTTLAGINAVNAQNARYAWLETGADVGRPGASTPSGSSASTTHPASTTDPVWWQLTGDEFHGQVIGRVDVAGTGPRSPVPPGIPRLPGPGQFYASPALSALLHSTPAAQLGDRYPGRQLGIIGSSALPSPNSLIIIVGHTAAQLAHVPRAAQITAISTTSPSSCSGACYAIGLNGKSVDLILSVVAAALLFPVLIFIGVATRLAAARREQRFAALRLVGATPRQVSIIAAVESTIAATTGVVAGFGLFYLLRSALAPIPFTGEPFFVHDLSLNLADTLIVAIGVPLAAAVVARLALRRVSISPLGVTRRVTPPAPGGWRLIPLLAGLAELAYFAHAGRPATTSGQILAFLPGILLIMTGLITAGPWLTMIGSRVMTRRATRPAALIAARRLSDNPQAGFRAISGLILALFVGSVAIGVITTMDANKGGATSSTAADRATLLEDFTDYSTEPPTIPAGSVPSDLLTELHSISGVRTTTVIYAESRTFNPYGPTPSVVSCAALAGTPALGRCPAGADTATIDPAVIGSRFAPAIWPAASVTAEQSQSLPASTLAVATDGSAAAIERARTVLEVAYPYGSSGSPPTTIAENNAQLANTKRSAGYQRLADVVILTSLPIAGATLAVSVVAGLNDRKRPFSLLRLTGAPIGMLRRVVTLESAVPLLIGAVASVGAGFLASYLFLRAQLSETLQPPGAAYYGVILAGLVASLVIIASTLPLLGRITGPETARNE